MDNLKILSNLLLAVALSFGAAHAQAPVQVHGRLTVKNHRIVDASGHVPQLRGISFSWSIWGGRKYYTPEVVDWLVDDFKVSLIRVAMAVEPDSGYLKSPNAQFRLVTGVIDRAIARGIYVLMDWHDHHADKNVEASKRFFSRIAQRYHQHPNIIYEIWNEPELAEWTTIKAYAAQVIGAIRKEDPNNLIIVGAPRWDQDVDVVAADPIAGQPSIAYSFHFYASDPHHQQALRAKADKAMQLGLPLFVTEWGVGESNGDGVFDRDLTRTWLTWMENRQLSWANWNLTDKRETTALLNPGASIHGGWTQKELTPAGKYIRDQLRRMN